MGKSIIAVVCLLSFSMPWIVQAESKTFADQMQIENEASIRLWYDVYDDILSIGYIEDAKSGWRSTGKKVEELKSFFDKQEDKSIVFVVLCKNNFDTDAKSGLIKKLNEHFFEYGYDRVVVDQAHGGALGYSIISDESRKP